MSLTRIGSREMTVGQSSLCDGRSGVYKRKKYELLVNILNIGTFL